MLRAARWKCRTQKNRQKLLPAHHHTNLLGYIFGTKARIDNQKKTLLISNMSSTCPHNMVNFGLLAARSVGEFEVPLQISTVSRLGSVTAPHSSSGRQPKLAALNRGRHLYSAGSRHVGLWPTSLVMATGCGVRDGTLARCAAATCFLTSVQTLSKIERTNIIVPHQDIFDVCAATSCCSRHSRRRRRYQCLNEWQSTKVPLHDTTGC